MVFILQSRKLDRAFDVMDTVYKVVFLLFGFFSYNSFTFGNKIMSLFVIASTTLAGLLLVYRIIKWRSFANNKLLWILFLFLLSYGISMVLNAEYNLSLQIKTMVWMGMQYVLLYATDERKRVFDLKKQFDVISWVYLSYMFVASLISMILMFVNYSKIKEIGEGAGAMRVLSGFVWGRLWGVFTDPNYGAVMACVAVILSLYYIFTNKNTYLRVVLAVNIVLQTAYMTFSDSRTGIVAVFVSAGVFVFCLLMTRKVNSSAVVKSISCIILSVVVMFSYIMVMQSMKNGYNMMITNRIENSYSEEEATGDETTENYEEMLVGREADLEGDISNRRFDLWGASFDIIKARPVFGVSFNNLQRFTQENFPENYLVNNDHGKFNNYHNVLFNILGGQGLFGLVIFIAMGAYAGIKSIIKVKDEIEGENSIFYISVFSVVLALLAGSMFVSDLVYVNSSTATMFWYCLGIMMAGDRIFPAKKTEG